MSLTAEGDAAFGRLRAAAVEFNRRLRAGLGEDDLVRLRELLETLAANVAEPAG
jgi:MarR family transcriptional regulator, transcriptional regulator for hemolysin